MEEERCEGTSNFRRIMNVRSLKLFGDVQIRDSLLFIANVDLQAYARNPEILVFWMLLSLDNIRLNPIPL